MSRGKHKKPDMMFYCCMCGTKYQPAMWNANVCGDRCRKDKRNLYNRMYPKKNHKMGDEPLLLQKLIDARHGLDKVAGLYSDMDFLSELKTGSTIKKVNETYKLAYKAGLVKSRCLLCGKETPKSIKGRQSFACTREHNDKFWQKEHERLAKEAALKKITKRIDGHLKWEV